MFNILSEAASETADQLLNKANGEPMIGDEGQRCSITFYGPATDQFAAMQLAQRKRMRDQVARSQDEVSIEADRRHKAEDLAAITKSFNHFEIPGGFPDFAAQALACYLEPKLGFVRDQANAFVSNWGNFPPASKKR
jgi:hypothetical protein